jgi:hypothetical protein
MLNTTITATLTQTRDRKPLTSIRNLPGGDAELTPAELRALAQTLCEIADASDALPMNSKRFTPRQKEFSITEQPTMGGHHA